jgi:NAD(P)-dependent dehydrogenase (short-subunit alcohol dehydrogenase family)
MNSFPTDGIAVVTGGSGGIGAALVAALRDMPVFTDVVSLSRQTGPSLDITSEASIAAALKFLSGAKIRLVIDATGFLHGEGFSPEKSLKEISAAHMQKSFAVNAIGPALLMKSLLPLLPRTGKAVFATLSARVGSIGDNQIGGWYSYRAAKAALNQLVHTAAIELKRTRPEAICVALHPGTVATPLSAPFAKAGLKIRPPEEAARDLLAVIESLSPAQSGGFFDYRGTEMPW